ncbi:MAG: hypothetical protein AAB382_06810, partial [Chloroflexota bacterium]
MTGSGALSNLAGGTPLKAQPKKATAVFSVAFVQTLASAAEVSAGTRVERVAEAVAQQVDT